MTDLSKWAEGDFDVMLAEVEASHGSAIFDTFSHLDPARAARQMTSVLGLEVTPFMLNDARALVLGAEGALSGGGTQTLTPSLVAADDSFHAPSSAYTAPAAYVQGKVHGNGGGASTTVAATLDAAAQSGSAVLVSVGYASGSGTVSGVTDDKGNTYTILDTVHDVSFSYSWVTAVALGVTNAPATVTATMSSSFSFATILVDEVSNVSAVRSHTAQANSHPGTGTDAASSGNTSAVVGDFVYGSAVNITGDGLVSGTDYTSHQSVTGAFATEHKVATATTVATTFTPGGTDDILVSAVVLH